MTLCVEDRLCLCVIVYDVGEGGKKSRKISDVINGWPLRDFLRPSIINVNVSIHYLRKGKIGNFWPPLPLVMHFMCKG